MGRSYSPRAIYKGGGKYVCRLDASNDEVEIPREKYAERIINFEKTREKHKEIHPPMAFLKNKPLSCAKYFVEDIICADNNSKSEHERPEVSRESKRRTSCCADCPPSPEKVNQSDETIESDEEDYEKRRRQKSEVYDRLYWNAHGSRATVLGGTATPEPPTTAEYVAYPKWRQHSPEKWVGGRPFTSTISSSNTHTASRCSITGTPYSRTLLLDEPFAPAGITNSPTTPQVRAYEHSRRMKMAADAAYKPAQRPDKKYFNSMWTEPADSTKSRHAVTFDTASSRPTTVPSSQLPSPSHRRNAGRELLQQIRQQHQPAPTSPTKQQQRRELGDLALAHLGDALVPAADHLAGAQLELERAAAVAARVELGAVREGAHVVHGHGLAGLGEVGAVAAWGGGAMQRLGLGRECAGRRDPIGRTADIPGLDGVDLEAHGCLVSWSMDARVPSTGMATLAA
ncbi:unnamed protein product [Phytophthora fragariaefolia]|uniref:Unnamed protein product n=1 Tax=Phytophthora fragariaefolia TaxID=1490495 RepID=A0A9W6TN54_9STRA|nr:unnamed protein product [Phytophthora fragariaefolia]